jgi:hypothetical protein
VEVWMHTTGTFKRAIYSLNADLKSAADDVLRALVVAYTRLLHDPWNVARGDPPQGARDTFVHSFFPGYVLVYRIQGEFTGEATLIRQHVYLMNVLRQSDPLT